MVKYRLSKNVNITFIEDEYDDIPSKYKGEYFVMYDNNNDNDYVINASVKYYIDKFPIYKTEEEVFKEIAKDVQADADELKETCSAFFTFLCKRKILVPDNETEVDALDETLYKEDDWIDDMHILNVLSSRHYTDVYSAIDKMDGRIYVIKLLNRKKAINETRFQKELSDMEAEYKMLQKTNHIPAINKAYGFKKANDKNPYLMLEYIAGNSLSRYIEDGMLSYEDSFRLIEAIITAFSSLHESRIIHGDIHASNILVTNEKDVKIIDLGMAINAEVQENQIMRSGGVYFYMPPERINIASFNKFSKEPDLFSDVYQIGIIIYLILYNTFPFDGFIWEELAQSIKENKIVYRDVSFLNYPVPASLVNIVKKCLDKDPAKRYGNASGILTDIKKLAFAGKEFSET